MGHRLWLTAVAIHRLGVVEITPSPHRCFRTAHPCAQSVKGSPTWPVLSRSSWQILGLLQSHFDGGWHVCQAVFPELQPAAACRRVERRDGAHEALPRLQSASSLLVMEQLEIICNVLRGLQCKFSKNPCLLWKWVGGSRGQDYKEKHKTRLKTNGKRTVLNNTKLRHF